MLVGKPAPEFAAPAAFCGESSADPLKTVSLADYRGKWLLFFWYPLDFTFVCPTEILAFSDRYDAFLEHDCDILGASCDSAYSHRAWLRIPRTLQGVEGCRYPLLSDMTRSLARSYEVLIESAGFPLRGLFLIDPDGIVQHATINNNAVGRNVEETLRLLQAFQSGGLCASDWKPGQENLQPG